MGRRSNHSGPYSSTALSSPLHPRALGSSCEPMLYLLPARYVESVDCCANQQMQHLSISYSMPVLSTAYPECKHDA